MNVIRAFIPWSRSGVAVRGVVILGGWLLILAVAPSAILPQNVSAGRAILLVASALVYWWSYRFFRRSLLSPVSITVWDAARVASTRRMKSAAVGFGSIAGIWGAHALGTPILGTVWMVTAFCAALGVGGCHAIFRYYEHLNAVE